MKFDDVLKHVGEFGLYQKRVYFLLCLFSVFHAMRMVVLVFLQNTPSFRCAIPDYPNDTYEVTSVDHELKLNRSIPPGDFCHILVTSNSTFDENNRPMNASLAKCNRWVFDTSVFTSTIASQFSLVCDDTTKISHSAMSFYGGLLIGTFILGFLSDLIGRKLCLYISLTFLLLLGVGQSFADSYIAFAILNFFVGVALTGIFPSAYVIGIEIVGPSKRTNTGMITQLFFSTGVVSVAGLAYLIRSWQYLLLAITAPLVLFFTMWCFIPESPRWQIQKGHYSKARETVLTAAKVNKTSVPQWILDVVMPLEKKDDKSLDEENVQKGKFIDLFKSKTICKRTLISFFLWFAIAITFYGLIFNTTNLGSGSIFLNFFLSGLVEFPAHILTLLTIDKLGRKRVLFGMMMTSGLACLGCVLSIMLTAEEHQWLTVTLAMIGKFGAAGCYGCMYMYTAELFPTVIRNSALGAGTSCARLGAMFAPYVALEGAKSGGTLGQGVPLLVFGCLIVFGGALLCFMPETLNKKLPETVTDIKNFSKLSKTTEEEKIELNS
nr:organic cation transporter protein [Biomphalaria glabrata]